MIKNNSYRTKWEWHLFKNHHPRSCALFWGIRTAGVQEILWKIPCCSHRPMDSWEYGRVFSGSLFGTHRCPWEMNSWCIEQGRGCEVYFNAPAHKVQYTNLVILQSRNPVSILSCNRGSEWELLGGCLNPDLPAGRRNCIFLKQRKKHYRLVHPFICPLIHC